MSSRAGSKFSMFRRFADSLHRLDMRNIELLRENVLYKLVGLKLVVEKGALTFGEQRSGVSLKWLVRNGKDFRFVSWKYHELFANFESSDWNGDTPSSTTQSSTRHLQRFPR